MRIASFDWDGRDARALAAEIRGLQPTLGEVSGTVAEIIEKVRSGGDRAVAEIEAQVGGSRLQPSETRISEEEIRSAAARPIPRWPPPSRRPPPTSAPSPRRNSPTRGA
jgi:histidinol dehydrogenase